MTAPDVLIQRWTSPEGQDVLRRVLDDLRNDGGLNLPGILEVLPHTAEVRDGLDLRYAPL